MFLPFFAVQDICGEPPSVEVQAEYRYDDIDQSGDKKHFLRDMVNCMFSDMSSVSFTHVYIEESDTSRYTWNLYSGDMISHATILAGHYYAHLGRGLLVGRQMYYDEDPFSGWRVFAADRAFRACRSGNPAAPLYGAAVSFKIELSDIIIEAAPFYSRRERYVSDDDYEDKEIASSFQTLLQKTEPGHNPAIINDAGMIVTMQMWKRVTLQAYSLYTDITRENDILYEWGRQADGDGLLKHYLGLGLYAQYSDDYLRIYLESAFPCTWDKNGDTAYSFGCIFGLDFRMQGFECFFSGKHCTDEFYAPQGCYSDLSGLQWRTGLFCDPVKNHTLGFQCSSERNSRPGRGEDLLKSAMREELSYALAYARDNELQLKGIHLEQDYGEGIEERYQTRIKSSIMCTENIMISIKGMYQNYAGSSAGMASLALVFSVKKIFKLQPVYTVVVTEDDERVYYSMLPSFDTVSPGMFVKETSHLAGLKCSISYKGLRFFAKYWAHVADLMVLSHHYEFFLEYRM